MSRSSGSPKNERERRVSEEEEEEEAVASRILIPWTHGIMST